MRRILLFFAIIVSSSVLIVSTSDRLMRQITQYRTTTTSALESDKYRYCDLYGLSYLHDFKTENNFLSSDVPVESCPEKRFINLYVAGDSYLGDAFVTSDSIFCAVKSYSYLKTNSADIQSVHLAKGETNVLLIEVVERDLRSFSDTNYIEGKLLVDEPTPEQSESPLRRVPALFFQMLSNPSINQNIEFNIFDYKIFTPLKEMKASLNWNLFGRINNDALVSPDGKFLLYRQTIDPTSKNSSFASLPDEEADNLVRSLNTFYSHYKSKGFDDVLLAVIPNPVTILYPQIGTYNGLIPRVQYHRDLKIPIIDIYNIFTKTKMQIYFTSDTHWNMNGFHLWLNEFNRKLRTYHEK